MEAVAYELEPHYHPPNGVFAAKKRFNLDLFNPLLIAVAFDAHIRDRRPLASCGSGGVYYSFFVCVRLLFGRNIRLSLTKLLHF